MQFEEICRENYARIYNYILAKTGEKEAAEETEFEESSIVSFQKETATMVITTTDEAGNEREYLSTAGISFKLSDDTEFGDVRTTTMFTDGQYETILQFTGMSEEEIREVLDNICG